ncbi:hypothetical protein N800_01660 [Lysobacter daejeonensis GH1-9]|uniref:Uncharacterized protein n=1 Tax=Lysobacter daejeonensis GH1-9 TaxID=1385517 RepID=A0A0A0F0Q8_9GAMM|nr:hypothetical protein N800_01660 [Lysobacter daejeonensis GH1-9]
MWLALLDIEPAFAAALERLFETPEAATRWLLAAGPRNGGRWCSSWRRARSARFARLRRTIYGFAD